ncbi:MAG: transposase [Thiotrichales bacterium]|nr:MAG: transposase [Thiotrichales bacterium]
MPRAHRYFLPGHVWHITHRCHKKEYLLKFAKDRERWRYWLYQAKKRYGLSVLNYIVTSNHIHLLVHDRGKGEIVKSMQLIAGRTAQEYNQRKDRKGAFWEDRYHATAVETNKYLARCIAYIDLNMVRAGVVSYPEDWIWSGYYEIQYPSPRYKVIDEKVLLELSGVNSVEHYREIRRDRVEAETGDEYSTRDENWSSSLAVGSAGYIDSVKSSLGVSSRYRNKREGDNLWVLRELANPYRGYFDR